MRATKKHEFSVRLYLHITLRSMLGVLCMAIGEPLTAESSDPLILFNRDRTDAILYSYFDTTDPGMPKAVDIALFPRTNQCRTLGVFNGILYVDLNDGELAAVSINTGLRLNLDLCLPENYILEDGIIYGPPVKRGPAEVNLIDLRGPFARTVPLPPSPADTPLHNPYAVSVDGLRHLYRNAPVADGDRDIVTGYIVDLRALDSFPLTFRATVPVSWRVEAPHWRNPQIDDPNIALMRVRDGLDLLSLAWTSRDRFACIALTLEIEEFVLYSSDDNTGGPHLFVADLKERTVRAFPLSSLPVKEPVDPMKGGPDPDYYQFDTVRMTPREDYPLHSISEPQQLSTHFFASRNEGALQVTHGAEPLTMMRNSPLVDFEVDPSGERVLLSYSKKAFSYDIYCGYYAETEYLNYYGLQDRRELPRIKALPPPGWHTLLEKDAAPESPAPSLAYAPIRRQRAVFYTLAAEATQPNYPETSPVKVNVSLTLTGEEGAWTDVPSPANMVLSGTLAGPANSLTISKLANGEPMPVPVPVFLDSGGTLSYTLTFTPTSPGDYTLALAYGGNAESDWYGRVHAPLVHFSVGNGAADEHARLRYAIQDFIDRHGKMNDVVFKEIEQAGDAGVDVLASMLLEIPIPESSYYPRPDDEASARRSAITDLYSYLLNLREPRLVTFYAALLTSGDREKKSNGFSGIALLYYRSKDPEFRASIEGIVRDAYANDDAVWRTRVAQDLKVDLFPTLYGELKAQAASADLDLRREALNTLARYYLCRLGTFAGDMETYTVMMLEEEKPELDEAAVYCVEQFYSMKTDRPSVERAIDDYRVRYPEHFNGRFLDTSTDLWDMAWLRRTAGEPTEARFTLLLRCIDELEKHCGIVRGEGFPDSWQTLQGSDEARSAFAATLSAWADCLESTPASFRVPLLDP